MTPDATICYTKGMLSTSKRVRFQRAAFRRRVQYLIQEIESWRDVYATGEHEASTLRERWVLEERHAAMDELLAALERAMVVVLTMR